MKKFMVSFIIVIFVLNTCIAQNKSYNLNDGDINYNEISDLKINNNDNFDNATRFRELVINPVVQSNELIGIYDTISLDLFDNKHYKAFVDKINIDINGTITIRARLADYYYAYCIISTFNGKSFLTIEVPENNELFMSSYNYQTNKYYLLQIDKSKQKALPGSLYLIPPDDYQKIKNPKKNIQQDSLNYNPNKIEDIKSGNVINNTKSGAKVQDIVTLMIVYTPAAAAWSSANETNINNTISLLMAKAQLSLDNSNTQLTIQLVHSEQISYTELNTSDDLDNLTDPSDGIIDNVHTLRNTYCADLVVLLENINFTGGLGWLLNSASGNPNNAFSISRVQQASWSYTTIHEIGHNMGCGHHKLQNVQPGPGLFSYSAGWRWGSPTVKYCSVMTYSDGSSFPDGIDATEVAYFSNPSIQHLGYATGNATDGDNARTIRDVKAVVVAYRTGCNSNGCDTMTNILPNENLTLYGFGSGTWGTWTGHNSYLTAEFAEYYTGVSNTNITGLEVYVADAVSGASGGNHKVTFKVYQGGAATPGVVLGSKDVAISTLTPYDINYIQFVTPITFTGSNVYVGYQIYYNTPADTFSVAQAVIRTNLANSGFMKDGADWYSYPDISGDQMYSAIYISPIICSGCTMPAVAGTITGTATVCQGQSSVVYSVPSITDATSYIWSLPTGATGSSSSNTITVSYGISAVSGNITVKGHNTCGDGAISTKAIVVKTKPTTPTITQNGFILHSNAATGNQWYNQSGLISGAISQDYTVISNGSYHVIVTINGCSSNSSNIINVSGVGIESTGMNKTIKVYPNPVTNELIIEIEGSNETTNYEIFNSIGQLVYKGNFLEKTVVNTSGLSSGIYLIKLENGNVFEFKKVVKE